MSNRLHVIVVDDQADLAESIGRLLRFFGHDVSVYNSAESVLDALDSLKPDLIISYIGMPEMDGCELATRVKRRPGCENVVLAAITGFEDEEYRRAVLQAGFDYRFVKPMRADDLRRFVEKVAKKCE